jgi:cystathionine beta-lyase
MVFFPFGAKSALHLIVERLTDPGRPVLVFTPGYGGLRKVVRGAGRTVIEVPLRELGPCRYEPDLRLVRRTLARTRAATIVLCNPHNPLGLVWPKDSLAAIAALAHASDVLVISDEVHHWLAYDPATHAPWGSVALTDNWVVIDSVGKAFNIAGLPHSWAVLATTAAARPIRDALSRSGFYEGSALGDIAVAAALRHGATWLAERVTLIRDRMRLACDLLDQAGSIAHSTPTASFLLWLDLRGVVPPGSTAADDVLERTGVRLLDGRRFGADYDGYCRLNVATTEPILRRAIVRLNALSGA